MGDQDALRPDPVWMAIRRTVNRIARLTVVHRLQSWMERRSDPDAGAGTTEAAGENPLPDNVVRDTEHLIPGC